MQSLLSTMLLGTCIVLLVMRCKTLDERLRALEMRNLRRSTGESRGEYVDYSDDEASTPDDPTETPSPPPVPPSRLHHRPAPPTPSPLITEEIPAGERMVDAEEELVEPIEPPTVEPLPPLAPIEPLAPRQADEDDEEEPPQ
jgi:hypothetical protein